MWLCGVIVWPGLLNPDYGLPVPLLRVARSQVGTGLLIFGG